MTAGEIQQGRAVARPRELSLRPAAQAAFGAAARALAGARRGLGAALPDLVAVEFLLAVVAVLFRDSWMQGLVYHETDTSTMFYPVWVALQQAMARGELLAWSPELFSGFPLLAEGQTGVLYPLNWLLALALPTEQGFIWLRTVHFGLAVLFAYLFGRSLRLSPGPASIVGMSFGLGSFTVGQMQHGSVLASAVWLPLVLALAELGLRSRGRSRVRCLLLAGLALGMSALAVHVQTVVMIGGCFLAWIGFRLIFPPVAVVRDGRRTRSVVARERARRTYQRRTRLLRRLHLPAEALMRRLPTSLFVLLAPRELAQAGRTAIRSVVGRFGIVVWAAVTVPMIGMALAAGQLLPLYELSGFSGRAFGWSYQAATDYSLPLPNLLTLVFPHFFRDPQGVGWSLWQPWEVTYYAGVVPLALAVFGARARRREVLFFLPLVLGATMLALGDYSPVNLYAHLWNWPGMNLQRAPARFTFLGVFGIAVLAGIGSQTLWADLRTWPNGAYRGFRALALWLVGLVIALAVLIWHLVIWRAWVLADRAWATWFLENRYLSLRHDPGALDSAERAYQGLVHAVDLGNRQTALPLLLLAALLVLVVCWNELRRGRIVWQSLLVVLVAVDLVSFAQAFHPQVPIEEVADVGPAGRLLAAQSGLFRIYTDPEVAEPKANELLPWGISEIRAYDPLELSRHRVLLGSVIYVDNWLLDLFGVRYRLLPVEGPGMPSYRQVGFNPQHPLVSGSASNPSGREVWTVGAEAADELRVVSALEDAFGVADGEVVGEWILTEPGGKQHTFKMLAGRDSSDWAYDDPRFSVRPSHGRARVAFTFDLPNPAPSGARQVHLYYTSFDLPGRPTIERAEFRHLHAVGKMQVFGFGFFNRQQNQVAQFFDRAKYRPVMQQAGVLVQENGAAFPRAFAVPEAVWVASAESAIHLLASGPLQPRRQVVLEHPDASPFESPGPAAAAGGGPDRFGEPYGQVSLVEYRSDLVAAEVVSEGGYLVLTDAYFPGWRAYLDGEVTPIFRANYLFRAVAIPPGRHLVEFRYEPESLDSGLAIARLAVALVALALLASLAPTPRPRRVHWVRTP